MESVFLFFVEQQSKFTLVDINMFNYLCNTKCNVYLQISVVT